MAHRSKRFAALIESAKKRPAYWVSQITTEFAGKLEEVLESRGVSNSEFAEKAGTSPAYITKVLRGNANYTVETMVKLAMAADAKVKIELVPNASVEWSKLPVATLQNNAKQRVPFNITASNDHSYLMDALGG